MDLSDGYERDQNFLDAYSFDTLLLEIKCNMRVEEITKENIRNHVAKLISNRVAEALEIVDDNMQNIINQAKKERE